MDLTLLSDGSNIAHTRKKKDLGNKEILGKSQFGWRNSPAPSLPSTD